MSTSHERKHGMVHTVATHPRGKETPAKEGLYLLCFWLPWRQKPTIHVDVMVLHTTLGKEINYDINSRVKVVLRASVWGGIMIEFEWWLLEDM